MTKPMFGLNKNPKQEIQEEIQEEVQEKKEANTSTETAEENPKVDPTIEVEQKGYYNPKNKLIVRKDGTAIPSKNHFLVTSSEEDIELCEYFVSIGVIEKR